MATSLDLARTYTSFAGVDIRVIMNGELIGSMQALSYAIQREKAPIYVMGHVDPIAFSRGKRGIAGTMISLLLDKHLLYTTAFNGEHFVADTDEVYPGAPVGSTTGTGAVSDALDKAGSAAADTRFGVAAGNWGTGSGISGDKANLYNMENETNASVQLNTPAGVGTASQFMSDTKWGEADVSKNWTAFPVWYVDQIMPFDIAIVAVNEYGRGAQMRLYGCEILNEGSGFSIDDIVIENQMTYVCRTLLPWTPFTNSEWAAKLWTKEQDLKLRGAENSSDGSDEAVKYSGKPATFGGVL